MTDGVGEIVAGLSEYQRDRLISGTDIGCVVKFYHARMAMITKGLAVSSSAKPHHDQCLDWTDLGLAVRAALLSEKPHD